MFCILVYPTIESRTVAMVIGPFPTRAEANTAKRRFIERELEDGHDRPYLDVTPLRDGGA